MVDEFIKEHTGKKKSCCGICKKHKNQQDIDSFLKMKKPDICGSLQSASIFRHPWKSTNCDNNQGNPLNKIELEIMKTNKINLSAENKILAIEQSPECVNHTLDEP